MAESQEKCPHCGSELLKWIPPEASTWDTEFQWVCFNDECSYFLNGWEHMLRTQNIKASYRYRKDPITGSSGPLPCWSQDAHKDHIIS